jgi:hypothetical protein
MDPACNNFLLLNIIFAVVNTILMGVLVWQLWVVRSRVDRFEVAVMSFVDGVSSRVRGAVGRISALVHEVRRAAMGR